MVLLRYSLFAMGLSCLTTSAFGMYGLFDAIEKCNVAIVRRFLREGADLNQRLNDGSNKTPLHVAAAFKVGGLYNFFDGFEIIRLLLTYGANPDARDTWGRTPLAYAAGDRERMPMVQLLLQTSPDSLNDQLSFLDKNPEICGASQDKLNIIKMCELAYSLIHYVTNGNLAAVKQNVGERDSVNTIYAYNFPIYNKDGNTMLHLAVGKYSRQVVSDSDEMVRLFVQRGANVNAANRFDETALTQAVKLGNRRIIRYLLKHGARPSLTDIQLSLQSSLGIFMHAATPMSIVNGRQETLAPVPVCSSRESSIFNTYNFVIAGAMLAAVAAAVSRTFRH